MAITLPIAGSSAWNVPLDLALSTLAHRGFDSTDLGFQTWNFEPWHAITYTSTQPVSGTVVMMKMPRIAQARTITGVTLYRAVVASGLTAAYVGLYDSAGTKLRESANDSANWAALGMRSLAFTSTYPATVGQDLYAAMLFVGTTPPGIAAAQIVNHTSNLNGSLTAATALWANGATGQTTLPASITMASRTLGLTGHWAGLH